VEFFVSRASADAAFAAAVGEILTEAGHGVVLQQWDFANRNFMERMHAALADGARVVALLSPEYLRSAHCQAEWQNAIANDPLNTESRLIVLRVAECEPVGLLSGLAYWDLVPVADNRALLRDIVLDAVRNDRERMATSGPYWRAPRSIIDGEAVRPVPGFAGREEALAALSAALSRDGTIAIVQGLGGVGKSSVAREFAWRNREHFSVIWWLNAENENGIVEGLLRLGSLFVRGLEQHADRRAAGQQVVTSMLGGFAKPVLLVFDNLDDEQLLHAWRPRTGSVLATSRNAAWGADITIVPLHSWQLDTAIGYLQRESARTDLTESDAREIAEALGALPLALAHAAASLRGMRMVTPGRYLERIGQHLKNAPRGAEYPQSVFATFTAAIAQAEKEAAGAAAVLAFAASFAPDAIPDELFRQSVEYYPAELHAAISDDFRLDEALGALDRLSLLAFSEASRTYSMHRLVQLAALDTIGDTKLGWRECAVAVADAAFPEPEFKQWPQCERLLAHARAALDALPEAVAFLPAARLAQKCAIYLRERGDYASAEMLAKRELGTLEATYGTDHVEVATSLDELAVVLYRQARYDEANELRTRALRIQERTYGGDHLDVAKTLQGLANVAYEQTRYDEAESLHKRALTIREAALGVEHPDVARSLNDLANVAHELGNYDEAVSLYLRALEILENTLDSDHPLVPTLLNNLATSYEWQGRYAEAESVHTRALAMLEKVLGPDHPTVATSMHNLAIIYQLQERYDEAIALYTRALDIRERMLGPEHPDVARSLHELSIVYLRQARYDEAEPLQKRALAIREKTFGPEHYEVAMSLNDLARLREAQGRFEEAELLHARALAIREKALRQDHPDVAISLSALADLYARRARYHEAIDLYVRALAIREKAFGADHALTKAVRKELERLQRSHPSLRLAPLAQDKLGSG
jgi:tetratricopeptide (TPR) repeat protein